ncbi:MAG TPA: hypothetical protein VGO48_00795 [Conexibacter sp.]|nr:hypothetical protein [Conexibacter sp.]
MSSTASRAREISEMERERERLARLTHALAHATVPRPFAARMAAYRRFLARELVLDVIVLRDLRAGDDADGVEAAKDQNDGNIRERTKQARSLGLRRCLYARAA